MQILKKDDDLSQIALTENLARQKESIFSSLGFKRASTFYHGRIITVNDIVLDVTV